MVRPWRIRTAHVVLLIAGSGPWLCAQSRATSLSVSAVVVPRCAVATAWPAVSLRCSGQAARTVRTAISGQARAHVRTADANRVEVAWTGVPTAGSLLLIDF